MIIKYGSRTLFGRKSKQGKSSGPSKGLLPEGGRSSKEVTGSSLLGDLTSLHGLYDFLNPYIPVEVLKFITLQAVINPDMSQARKNAIRLGNNGHKVRIHMKTKRDRVARAAHERINAKAPHLCEHTHGVDGLFNDLFNQQMIGGPISGEAVIEKSFKGVDKVVLVPTPTIRFKLEEGRYQAYQFLGEVGGNLSGIPLNPLTYTYIATDRMEHSPYALPPFISALEPLVVQKDMFTNIRVMVKKLGLLGLNVVKVKRLQRIKNESETAWAQRNQAFIKEVANGLSNNYYKGILVLPEEQELANHKLTGDARGVSEVVKMIEEQVFSGLCQDPALGGRSYSTTETYAGVVYEVLLALLGNMRQAVKRFMEKVYMLDLSLFGLPVDGVSIVFNPDKSLNPNTETLGQRYKLMNTLDKAKSGMISPDVAAQEEGYSEWDSPDKLEAMSTATASQMAGGVTLDLEFDRSEGQYVYRYPFHDLDSYKTDEKGEDDKTANKAERKLQEWITKALTKELPYFDDLNAQAVVDWAVDFARDNLEAISEDSTVLFDALREHLKGIPAYKEILENKEYKEASRKTTFDAAQYFKEIDLSVFGGNKPSVKIRFGDGDKKAAEMHETVKRIYASRFLDDKTFGTEMRKFAEDFFKKGESVQNGWTDEVEKEFIRRFGYALEGDLHSQMRLIVESHLGRIQSYSRVEQMYEGGIKKSRIIVAPGCCKEICEPMRDKEFIVADVRKVIQSGFVNAETPEAALEFIKQTTLKKEDTDLSIEDLVASGKGFPKYHPHCRCINQGVINK